MMDERREEAAQEQAERFESIPWSSLVPPKDAGRKRVLVMAGTVLVGVLVGLAAGSVLRRDGGRSTVVTLPPIAISVPAAVAPDIIERADDPVAISADQTPPLLNEPSSAVAPVAPRLFSEADLMAVLPEEEMRAAVMRAEWFVTDFFTVDGASSAESDVTAALATRPDEVPLPHATAADGISYVEWARAFFVEPVEPGTYRVSVAFRTLTGADAADLSRSQVRAVAVSVRVGARGATIVTNLPAPLGSPASLSAEPQPFTEAEAPDDVLAAAFAAAMNVGSDPAPLLVGTDDEGWRVVVMVGGESGMRWPLAVRP